MIGLFDRDYRELTKEKIEEKNKIDTAMNPSKGKFGKIKCFRSYPQAIRYNQSLFPNNYMDINLLQNRQELEKQADGLVRLLDNHETTELNVKRYIQDNKYYCIPASIFVRYYTFGHHEAVLFKEFPLGTSYKADYLLAGRGSGGWQFIFVEFECVYGNIFLKDGSFGSAIRKGKKQIEDWKKYLEANYTSIYTEFKRYTNKNLPDEFVHYDSSRMHYVIITGRRADFDNDTRRWEQRNLESKENIDLCHYDNLLDDFRSLIGRESY